LSGVYKIKTAIWVNNAVINTEQFSLSASTFTSLASEYRQISSAEDVFSKSRQAPEALF
jgi:hypothetical protein